MRKSVALIIGVMLALAACAGALAQAQVPNPIVEVASVQAIEQQLGVKMPLPSGASASNCAVIGDSLGQVTFKYSSVEYTFRAKLSAEEEDISGVYADFAVNDTIEFDGIAVTLCLNEGAVGMMRWYKDGTSYALIIDERANEDALVEALIEILYA